MKNTSFILKTAIHLCAAACRVAVTFAVFGTAAVSVSVLALSCR